MIMGLAISLIGVGPASAHQPVTLTAADSRPSRGPVLMDGTVSFAVYANVRGSETRGFRVRMRAGQRLDIQLLIPDRAPANQLKSRDLPEIVVMDPAGRRTTMPITERTPFYEPYSGTSFLYLARTSTTAIAGTYMVWVKSRSATPVDAVVAVGYREVPGVVRP